MSEVRCEVRLALSDELERRVAHIVCVSARMGVILWGGARVALSENSLAAEMRASTREWEHARDRLREHCTSHGC
jgi:hypothetical protein